MKFLLFFTFIIVITLYNRKYLGNLTPIIVFTSLLLYLISRYVDFTEVLQKLSNNKKEGFDGNIEQYKNNIIYSNFDKFTFNNTNKVLSDSSDLKLTDKFTVMVWVKQNEKSTDWVRVIGKGDATHRNYGIWIQNNNRLLAQIYPLSKGRNIWPTDNKLETNTWTHLAMTFHKDNQHKLYKNGQLIKEEDTSGTPLTDDEPLTIGGAEFHAKFNGEITGAVVLNTVLDEDDIKKFAESPDKDLDDIFNIIDLPKDPTYSWDFRVNENVGVKDKYNNIVAKYENGLESNENDGTIFNGNDNVIKVGENQTINIGGVNKGKFSIEMYIYINKLQSNTQYELLRLADTNDHHLHIGINGNWGGIGAKYSITFTGSTEPDRDKPIEYIGLGTPKAGEWLHILWSSNVVDPVRSSVMSLYVNSTQHNHGWGGNRYNPELMKSISAISNTFGAGKNQISVFDGKIAYIRMWDGYALTSSDITQLYNTRSNRMAYYNPDNFSLPKPKPASESVPPPSPSVAPTSESYSSSSPSVAPTSESYSAPSPSVAPPSESYSAPSPSVAPPSEGDPMRLIEEGDKMSQIDNYEKAIDNYNKALIQLTDSTDVPNEDIINELYSKISTEYRNLAATFNCDKEKEPNSEQCKKSDQALEKAKHYRNKLIGDYKSDLVKTKDENKENDKKEKSENISEFIKPPTLTKGLTTEKVTPKPVYFEPGTVNYGGMGYIPSHTDITQFNNMKFTSNPEKMENMNVKGFCSQSENIMENINAKCNKLPLNVCSTTECCVLLGGEKCVEGDVNGPKNSLIYSDTSVKNRDVYYYQGKCYGNCE